MTPATRLIPHPSADLIDLRETTHGHLVAWASVDRDGWVVRHRLATYGRGAQERRVPDRAAAVARLRVLGGLT